uniref:Protein kinase domain-containing protein n=1 Tax=Ditylenchus dipsaci TaxID=166011 RepID=A0A915D860_9BILA
MITRLKRPCSKYLAIIPIILFFLFIDHYANGQDSDENLPVRTACFVRCALLECSGKESTQLKQCKEKCQPYGRPELCKKEDALCWSKCKNLPELPVAKGSGQQKRMESPKNLIASYNPNSDYGIDLKWNDVDGAQLYMRSRISNSTTKIAKLRTPKDVFCEDVDLRVAAVSAVSQISPFSEAAIVEKPKPLISAKMKLHSLVLENTPFELGEYKSNGTLKMALEYDVKKWLFGPKDLEVQPIFHMMSCAIADLENAVPTPDFYQGSAPNTVEAKLGADMMYRRCRFVFAVEDVRSNHCSSTFHISAGNDDFSTLDINCDTVTNCAKVERIEPPVCGQIDKFNATVINPDKVDWENPKSPVAVNISFEPILRRSRKKDPLYYVALYGNALNYSSVEERTFLGINMTDVLGNASNCEQLLPNGNCKNTPFHNIRITNLTMDHLYGVMLCAVMNPKDLDFSVFNITQKDRKPKTNAIFISSENFRPKPSKLLLIVGAVGAPVLLLILLALALLVWNGRQRDYIKRKKMALDLMRRETEQRYTDLPKRNDLWELERRNLIIYEDKKLGSGAFGAVYLGRLIGAAKGSKDAQSTLGVNLMRAENCEVAVKMLPEYADELSKSEFLREIGLMKTLGYHERLVNMLACVTNSEPYCLVMEHCSDGDLLHFLRDRCNYMLKLDKDGIDYSDPNCEYQFDPEMVMTVKQLLMYAVQISYGLEYLSQKGFVHRDVAARNVLVHQKHSVKIGDFGLCRYIYADSANYKGKGGRLPVKWMSIEAIRHYEFTTNSDIWSFGVLMFEIITLGGTPYPGIQPDDILSFLENGGRIPQPDNCPDEFYEVMKSCWCTDPHQRPEFSTIRQQLALQLERITDEYSYLKLDSQKDYYNVSYKEQAKELVELNN